MPFVPDDFVPPRELVTTEFRLVPLDPEHNDGDYEAWSSSMEHIHASPGFENWKWPLPMTAAENLEDLEGHAKEFAARSGFTYTVLDPSDGATIGCVYIYPSKDVEQAVSVHSWVRASRAGLDAPLRHAVRAWLAAEWPFENIVYAG